jgi:hypothetical protein
MLGFENGGFEVFVRRYKYISMCVYAYMLMSRSNNQGFENAGF